MKLRSLLSAITLSTIFLTTGLQATIHVVSTQQEFDDAHEDAAINDTIQWPSGTYSDIFMEIWRGDLFITAEELGGTIFTGASRVDIGGGGDNITLQGFQWLYGDIGDDNVINTRGSHNVFTQLNIRAYTCYKYLRIREECQYCVVSYCNFESRLNAADQNILSILVDEENPGYNKVQYCSFKNFPGGGNDEGVEPIRIGVSTQAEFISRSLVEYCYFTQCNGDGEIISNKARQNVFRFNTFEDNPVAELVLRHGSENIVYGNFFLNGKGGVRVREGQDQYIYNNYFQGMTDRPFYLVNNDDDPLDNINIAFNTVIDSDDIRLGGDGDDVTDPTNVTFANNIFANPRDGHFEQATGNTAWIGNIAIGDLGIPVPEAGITIIDPQLLENEAGFFGLGDASPAIDAAVAGYKPLPQYEGMDPIDTELLFDLMGQNRPASIDLKDLGCSEFPQDVLIQPIATEENTGPSYDTSLPTGIQNDIVQNEVSVKLFPNPVVEKINITIESKDSTNFGIAIFDSAGREVLSFPNQSIYPGKTNLSKNVSDLPQGVYTVRVANLKSEIAKAQLLKFIKTD